MQFGLDPRLVDAQLVMIPMGEDIDPDAFVAGAFAEEEAEFFNPEAVENAARRQFQRHGIPVAPPMGAPMGGPIPPEAQQILNKIPLELQLPIFQQLIHCGLEIINAAQNNPQDLQLEIPRIVSAAITNFLCHIIPPEFVQLLPEKLNEGLPILATIENMPSEQLVEFIVANLDMELQNNPKRIQIVQVVTSKLQQFEPMIITLHALFKEHVLPKIRKLALMQPAQLAHELPRISAALFGNIIGKVLSLPGADEKIAELAQIARQIPKPAFKFLNQVAGLMAEAPQQQGLVAFIQNNPRLMLQAMALGASRPTPFNAIEMREEVPFERWYYDYKNADNSCLNNWSQRGWAVLHLFEAGFKILLEAVAWCVAKIAKVLSCNLEHSSDDHADVLFAQSRSFKLSAWAIISPTSAKQSDDAKTKIGCARNEWRWGTEYHGKRTSYFKLECTSFDWQKA